MNIKDIKKRECFSIAIVGDLIPMLEVRETIIDRRRNDPCRIWGELYHTLQKADLIFANFEGIIIQSDEKRKKQWLPSVFSIGIPPVAVGFLTCFDNLLLSFANNHSADYGREAIEFTMRILEERQIRYVGMGYNIFEANSPRIITTPFMKVSFLAFTDLSSEDCYAGENQSGIAKLTLKNLRNSIGLARQKSDFTIVYLHTTGNVKSAPSFFADDHQRFWARAAVDCGADMIIGNQSHTVQFIERYKGKLIFHSLGAFLYDPKLSLMFAPDHPFYGASQIDRGSVLILKIYIGKKIAFDFYVTRTAYRDGELAVIHDSLSARLFARLIKLCANLNY